MFVGQDLAPRPLRLYTLGRRRWPPRDPSHAPWIDVAFQQVMFSSLPSCDTLTALLFLLRRRPSILHPNIADKGCHVVPALTMFVHWSRPIDGTRQTSQTCTRSARQRHEAWKVDSLAPFTSIMSVSMGVKMNDWMKDAFATLAIRPDKRFGRWSSAEAEADLGMSLKSVAQNRTGRVPAPAPTMPIQERNRDPTTRRHALTVTLSSNPWGHHALEANATKTS